MRSYSPIDKSSLLATGLKKLFYFFEGNLRGTNNEWMVATFGPVMETRIKTFPERIKGGGLAGLMLM